MAIETLGENSGSIFDVFFEFQMKKSLLTIEDNLKSDFNQDNDIGFKINSVSCWGFRCGRCIEVCPNDALLFQVGKVRVNLDKCQECGLCAGHCPRSCITVKKQKN